MEAKTLFLAELSRGAVLAAPKNDGEEWGYNPPKRAKVLIAEGADQRFSEQSFHVVMTGLKHEAFEYVCFSFSEALLTASRWIQRLEAAGFAVTRITADFTAQPEAEGAELISTRKENAQ